jgi:hypothetical protein
LRVHQGGQAARGGSHATIYEVEVIVGPGEVQVEMQGVDPADTDPATADPTREASAGGPLHLHGPGGRAPPSEGRAISHPRKRAASHA